MRFKVAAILLCGAALTSMAGCKKKGTGGGGGWFVGTEGLMVNVLPNGSIGTNYELGSDQQLNNIACRYLDEAYVVGLKGTLLHTSDSGQTWSAQDIGTGADLYGLATHDSGPVYVAGDGVFFTADPDVATGAAQWRNLGDGVTQYRAVATAQDVENVVLAVSADGGVWALENDALVKRTTIAGARSVGVSQDGSMVLVAGAGLSLSLDGGRTFRALEVDSSITFNDVGIDDERTGLAVGTNGAIARIDEEGRVLLQRVGSADIKTVRPSGNAWATAGFAGTADGQTLVTRDGGWSWTMGPKLGSAILGVDEIGDGHN
jgi:photosystem II stability/assembly factor-like uncharacterized protein